MTKGTTKIIDLRRNLNALYHLHVRHPPEGIRNLNPSVTGAQAY